MFAYVYENRIKAGDNRTVAGEKEIFKNFKELAMEQRFADIGVEDIPLRPRKPVSKKRVRMEALIPLSQRDEGFQFFGSMNGITPRLPKSKIQAPVSQANE